MVSPLPGKYECPGPQSEATLSLFAILINGDPLPHPKQRKGVSLPLLDRDFPDHAFKPANCQAPTRAAVQFRPVVPINQACLIRCLPNQTHLIQLISSLVKTPRPQMGASDKKDIQDAQCRFGNHCFGAMATV